MILPKNAVIPEKPVKLGEPIESWFCCPRCRARLFKFRPDAKANGIEIKCRKCKKIIDVSL